MPRIGGNPRDQYLDQPQSPFSRFPTPSRSEPYRPSDAHHYEDQNIDVETSDADADLPNVYDGNSDQMMAANDLVAPSVGHNDNLAEVLDDDFLTRLGMELAEKVQRDIEERAPWRRRFERGLEMMGLIESDIDDGAFPGASNVIHPLLAEAVTQFWARSMGELFPADGPAKAKVNGTQTKQKLDRAQRVADFMNYDMTVSDIGYMQESSRLLWNVPLSGMGYRKTYRDPVVNKTIGIFVSSDDIIVPAEATSLMTASRFAHRMRKSKNEVIKLKLSGFYRDIELLPPEIPEDDPILNIKQETSDVQPDGDSEDDEYELFEVCADLDIPGFEHTDESGQQTGLSLPYYVTFENGSRKVLSIYRGWREEDPTFTRRIAIKKYGFVPGFGYYDFGLLHLIGGLSQAATGALRVLLDSAATASLSGGFVSKNANLKGKTMVVSPGEWQPVDATSEDLKNCFFPIPVKEPSMALFNLVGLLVDGGKSFASTTEAMTGQGDGKNVAVGTISKLIEQGEKVMSTIHRMAHASLKEELIDRYNLAREHAPEDGYPYEVEGDPRSVYLEDFGNDVSITPVSDPNIFSSGQRLSISQMVYETAMANPDKVNRTKAIRRLYEAARVPDVDELVPDDPEPQTYDPNGEVQALLLGKPIMVAPEQPHDAHLKVLWAFATNPQYGGNPEVQKQVGPVLVSVIGQHLAYGWATHSRQMLGQMAGGVGYMDPKTGQMQQPQVAPPEQIATMLAQIAPQLAQVPGLPAIDGEDKDKGTEAEMAKVQIQAQSEQQKMALKQQEHQQSLSMKAEEHQFKIQELQAKTELKQKEMQMDMQIKQQQSAVDMQLQQQQAEQQSMMNERQAQIDMQTQERQAQMQEQQINRQAQMDEQKSNMEHQQMARDGQMQEQQTAQQMRHAEQKSKLDHLRGPPQHGHQHGGHHGGGHQGA